ncbi:DUF2332 family protein [Nocardia cyriacigeorgica]|uniref:DUF2332 family protein n=1 Tax=Nocardia cyriacigeorgica TaxID=135487 RepID=UPI003EE18890
MAASRERDTANDYGPKDLRDRRTLLNKAVGFDDWLRDQKERISLPAEQQRFETIEFDRDGNLVPRLRADAPEAEKLPPEQRVVVPSALQDDINAIPAGLRGLGDAPLVRSGSDHTRIGSRPSQGANHVPVNTPVSPEQRFDLLSRVLPAGAEDIPPDRLVMTMESTVSALLDEIDGLATASSGNSIPASLESAALAFDRADRIARYLLQSGDDDAQRYPNAAHLAPMLSALRTRVLDGIQAGRAGPGLDATAREYLDHLYRTWQSRPTLPTSEPAAATTPPPRVTPDPPPAYPAPADLLDTGRAADSDLGARPHTPFSKGVPVAGPMAFHTAPDGEPGAGRARSESFQPPETPPVPAPAEPGPADSATSTAGQPATPVEVSVRPGEFSEVAQARDAISGALAGTLLEPQTAAAEELVDALLVLADGPAEIRATRGGQGEAQWVIVEMTDHSRSAPVRDKPDSITGILTPTDAGRALETLDEKSRTWGLALHEGGERTLRFTLATPAVPDGPFHDRGDLVVDLSFAPEEIAPGTGRVRRSFRRLLEDEQWPAAQVDEVVLTMSEFFGNVARYAAGGSASVQAWMRGSSPDELVVHISDTSRKVPDWKIPDGDEPEEIVDDLPLDQIDEAELDRRLAMIDLDALIARDENPFDLTTAQVDGTHGLGAGISMRGAASIGYELAPYGAAGKSIELTFRMKPPEQTPTASDDRSPTTPAITQNPPAAPAQPNALPTPAEVLDIPGRRSDGGSKHPGVMVPPQSDAPGQVTAFNPTGDRSSHAHKKPVDPVVAGLLEVVDEQRVRAARNAISLEFARSGIVVSSADAAHRRLTEVRELLDEFLAHIRRPADADPNRFRLLSHLFHAVEARHGAAGSDREAIEQRIDRLHADLRGTAGSSQPAPALFYSKKGSTDWAGRLQYGREIWSELVKDLTAEEVEALRPFTGDYSRNESIRALQSALREKRELTPEMTRTVANLGHALGRRPSPEPMAVSFSLSSRELNMSENPVGRILELPEFEVALMGVFPPVLGAGIEVTVTLSAGTPMFPLFVLPSAPDTFAGLLLTNGLHIRIDSARDLGDGQWRLEATQVPDPGTPVWNEPTALPPPTVIVPALPREMRQPTGSEHAPQQGTPPKLPADNPWAAVDVTPAPAPPTTPGHRNEPDVPGGNNARTEAEPIDHEIGDPQAAAHEAPPAAPTDHSERALGPIAAVSDIGVGPEHDGRSNNEDAFDFTTVHLEGEAPVHLATVADGVGGSPLGGEAALAAVRAAVAGMAEASTQLASAGEFAPVRVVRRGMSAARAAVAGLAETPGQPNSPDAAIALAVVHEDKLVVDWAGDTRVYWLPMDGGQPKQLNVDDTIVPKLVADNVDEGEALAMSISGQLTRSLGRPLPDNATSHATEFTLDGRGYVLIATDGIWHDTYKADALTAIVRQAHEQAPGDHRAVAAALNEHAHTTGTRDNMTDLVIWVDTTTTEATPTPADPRLNFLRTDDGSDTRDRPASSGGHQIPGPTVSFHDTVDPFTREPHTRKRHLQVPGALGLDPSVLNHHHPDGREWGDPTLDHQPPVADPRIDSETNPSTENLPRTEPTDPVQTPFPTSSDPGLSAVIAGIRRALTWFEQDNALMSPLSAENEAHRRQEMYLLRALAADAAAGGIVAELLGPHSPPGGKASSHPVFRLVQAVHHRALSGLEPDLARWHTVMGGQPAHTDADLRTMAQDVLQIIRDNASELAPFLLRGTQINDPARARLLLPVEIFAASATGLPLRVLSIGACGMLDARAHLYRYRFAGAEYGNPDAATVIDDRWTARPGQVDQIRDLLGVRPQVIEVAGADLDPLQADNIEDQRRLAAGFVGTDNDAVRRIQTSFVDAQRAGDMPIDQESALTWLPRRLAEDRTGSATIVWDSMLRRYLSPEQNAELDAVIAQVGAAATPRDPLIYAKYEIIDGAEALTVRMYSGSDTREFVLPTELPNRSPGIDIGDFFTAAGLLPAGDGVGPIADAGETGVRPEHGMSSSSEDTFRSDTAQRAPLETLRLDDERRIHILDGDATGGGHRAGTGKPGKTEFPPAWSDDQIVDLVWTIARNWSNATLREFTDGRTGATHFWQLEHVHEGVHVVVRVALDGRILTAWPARGPGVVRNPSRTAPTVPPPSRVGIKSETVAKVLVTRGPESKAPGFAKFPADWVGDAATFRRIVVEAGERALQNNAVVDHPDRPGRRWLLNAEHEGVKFVIEVDGRGRVHYTWPEAGPGVTYNPPQSDSGEVTASAPVDEATASVTPVDQAGPEVRRSPAEGLDVQQRADAHAPERTPRPTGPDVEQSAHDASGDADPLPAPSQGRTLPPSEIAQWFEQKHPRTSMQLAGELSSDQANALARTFDSLLSDHPIPLKAIEVSLTKGSEINPIAKPSVVDNIVSAGSIHITLGRDKLKDISASTLTSHATRIFAHALIQQARWRPESYARDDLLMQFIRSGGVYSEANFVAWMREQFKDDVVRTDDGLLQRLALTDSFEMVYSDNPKATEGHRTLHRMLVDLAMGRYDRNLAADVRALAKFLMARRRRESIVDTITGLPRIYSNSGIENDDIQPEMLEAIAREVALHLAIYRNLRLASLSVAPLEDENVMARVRWAGDGIHLELSERFAINPELFRQSGVDGVEAGFHAGPAHNMVTETVTHELAHVLGYFAASVLPANGAGNPFENDWKVISPEVVKHFAGTNLPEDLDQIINFLQRELSGYSFDEDGKIVPAEAFAEAYTSWRWQMASDTERILAEFVVRRALEADARLRTAGRSSSQPGEQPRTLLPGAAADMLSAAEADADTRFTAEIRAHDTQPPDRQGRIIPGDHSAESTAQPRADATDSDRPFEYRPSMSDEEFDALPTHRQHEVALAELSGTALMFGSRDEAIDYARQNFTTTFPEPVRESFAWIRSSVSASPLGYDAANSYLTTPEEQRSPTDDAAQHVHRVDEFMDRHRTDRDYFVNVPVLSEGTVGTSWNPGYSTAEFGHHPSPRFDFVDVGIFLAPKGTRLPWVESVTGIPEGVRGRGITQVVTRVVQDGDQIFEYGYFLPDSGQTAGPKQLADGPEAPDRTGGPTAIPGPEVSNRPEAEFDPISHDRRTQQATPTRRLGADGRNPGVFNRFNTFPDPEPRATSAPSATTAASMPVAGPPLSPSDILDLPSRKTIEGWPIETIAVPGGRLDPSVWFAGEPHRVGALAAEPATGSNAWGRPTIGKDQVEQARAELAAHLGIDPGLLPTPQPLLRALAPLRNALSPLDETALRAVGEGLRASELSGWIGRSIAAEAAVHGRRLSIDELEQRKAQQETIASDLVSVLGTPGIELGNGGFLGEDPLAELRRLGVHVPGESGLAPLVASLAKFFDMDSRVELDAELYSGPYELVDAFEMKHPETVLYGIEALADEHAHQLARAFHDRLTRYPIQLREIRGNRRGGRRRYFGRGDSAHLRRRGLRVLDQGDDQARRRTGDLDRAHRRYCDAGLLPRDRVRGPVAGRKPSTRNTVRALSTHSSRRWPS